MIQKTIADFISDEPLPQVAPDQSVEAAVDVMSDTKSDCVLILDGDRLVGIFTERDFLNRVTAKKRPPAQTPIADVMTADPSTLRQKDRISYAINRMAVGGFRNIPIVDENARPVAVLSVRDVMRHLYELFAEVEGDAAKSGEWDEWTDLGGG
jgi:CBS domain-containing protein